MQKITGSQMMFHSRKKTALQIQNSWEIILFAQAALTLNNIIEYTKKS